jgi:Phosphoribosylanthranilate isomerase
VQGARENCLIFPACKKILERDDGLRVILAGGLNAENVTEIVQKLGNTAKKVVGVDVSSGVETAGSQDLEKIRAFVKAAKSIQR